MWTDFVGEKTEEKKIERETKYHPKHKKHVYAIPFTVSIASVKIETKVQTYLTINTLCTTFCKTEKPQTNVQTCFVQCIVF